jgi:PAS domain S-box-containing protein
LYEHWRKTFLGAGRRERLVAHGFALASSVGALLFRQALSGSFGPRPLLILFVLPVIFSAYLGGLWPGLTATACSALLTAYFIFPPLHSFAFDSAFDAAQWGVFILIGGLISLVMGALRSEFKARKKVENRLRALVERSGEFITLRDQAGTLLYSSPAVERILGYSQEEIHAKGFGMVIHPDDRSLAVSTFTSLRPGESETNLRMRVQSKDGRWHWLEGSVSNYLQDPVVQAIVSNFREVTERVHLEEKLAQANKMESIGRLAGGVAHDFNNLLTVIAGEADLLLEGAALPREATAGLQEIQQAAVRAAALTAQLTAFARKSMVKPRVLNLNTVVENALPMLKRLIGADIELSKRLDAGLGNTLADPLQIGQVLINLVVNARDAMPGGGKLTLETGSAALDAGYTLSHPAVPPGSYVMIAVSDTGHGMDAETLKAAFEPFFTTKPLGQGTGLGLATCYGIVEQAGGHILGYSEPGKGSTFKIYLPSTTEPVEPDESLAPLRPIHGRSGTVLLVEDEHGVRALASKILSRAGYRVMEAADGVEGLALGQNQSFDILVTDLTMPRMGGRELVQRLGALKPGLKVLYLSGYTQNAVDQHGILDADAQLLQKPFSAAELGQRVRDILG